MQIADGKVVYIHYTLKDDGGEILDSSEGKEPLAYIQGQENIIPGLEKTLAGKAVGDQLDVTVGPEEGYGMRDESLVHQVQRSAFEGVDDIELGMQFRVDNPDGPQAVTVTRIEESEITVDGNHPLAGETLSFAVEVAEIREPTAEEIEHGHVHGPGGHDH